MTTPPAPPSRLSRRQLLGGAVAGIAAPAATRAAVPAAAAPGDDDPLFMSATRLAALIRARQLSASEVVRLHIARLEAVNPRLNALGATCFERALQEAAAADAALARGARCGPLHGVPMTIKDSFDTEGVISTAGTLGRRDFVPKRDATVVARARAAGAILLGKSNTPEFTLGGGWKGTDNLVYGLTRNPYDTDYQPGASSGGAAALVAAGGASFDIGSDFGGSLRGPANACGLAALKPTHGRVPRSGHIIGYGGPYDSFQGIGPIARRVEDLALLLPIIAGPDRQDAVIEPVPLGDPAAVELSRLRVAWFASNGLNAPTAENQALVRQAAAWFRELGCRVVEDMPPKMAALSAARFAYAGAPGSDPMRRLLAASGTTQASPGLYLGGEEAPVAELTRAAEALDAIRSEQLAWIERYDLILCPAGTRAALPIDLERLPPPPGPRVAGISYLGVFNNNGWPAGVVRTGTSSLDPGLPLGIQVVGQPWRDELVLAAMAHIERRAGGYRRPPL
ncbi:amidase [Solimonas variicoloris]|uniref:amidase n=1 Tax=Solimonas variicoloris TaxID=254408 RepID=UPI000364F8BD|nr:amidase [Solimonas variicoloris]